MKSKASVTIYRRGVAPVQVPSSSDDSSSDDDKDRAAVKAERKASKNRSIPKEGPESQEIPSISSNRNKLSSASIEKRQSEEPGKNNEPIISDRRLKRLAEDEKSQRQQAEAASSLRSRSTDAERLREQIQPDPRKSQTIPAAKQIPTQRIEETTESESDSGSESESEDDFPIKALPKPVFVKKEARETVLESEKRAKEAEEAKNRKEMLEEQRKADSREMLLNVLRNEMKEIGKSLEESQIDDTDGLDEDEEFNGWKLRELLRIKRDREERQNRLVDEEDIERRRNMTDEQIAEENKDDGKLGVEKAKANFLQKYYHKGVQALI
jgi:microfibrillar-associated protein 1